MMQESIFAILLHFSAICSYFLTAIVNPRHLQVIGRRAQKLNNNCNDKHFWVGVRICRGLHTAKTAYECTQGSPNETIGSYSIGFAQQLIYIWVHQKLLLHYTMYS